MCNLPDGVTDDMLPGGSQADADYEKLADQVPDDCPLCGTSVYGVQGDMSDTAHGFAKHVRLIEHDDGGATLSCARQLDTEDLLNLVAEAARKYLRWTGLVSNNIPDSEAYGPKLRLVCDKKRKRLHDVLQVERVGVCSATLASSPGRSDG